MEDIVSPVHTIYFGGGTPSLLQAGEINSILATIRKKFHINVDAEITLEANPDDIDKEKLESWQQAGINRLSIGVQSFFEDDLRWMNRAHNAAQAIEQLQLAGQYFSNITMDLIYGSPGLTDEKWESNLDTAISLGIPHLSCYALTVEPRTPLDKMIRLQQSANVDPEQQSRQFLFLMQYLKEKGYEHYEISNFALPGFRSRHNSSYWKGESYIGLGPGAHSYNGNSRWWNIANNSRYIKDITAGTLPIEKETLTPAQIWNETIMIRLRTMEGLDLDFLATLTPTLPAKQTDQWFKKIREAIQSPLSKGHIAFVDNNIILTDEGKLFADGIAADLFLE